MAKTKWKYKYLAQTYELMKGGMSETKAAQVLGIAFWTFRSWKKKKPYFKAIVQAAKKAYKGNNGKVLGWTDYVYKQLSDEEKILWRKINKCDSLKNGVERIEALFKDGGLRIRQKLFIHAWLVSNFSLSQALRKANISRGTFKLWKNNDPGFAELTEDIQWYYKEWVQDHLTQLIAFGDSSATIFANRTLNRDRFPEKSALDVNLKGTLQQTVVDLSKLKLPLKTKKQILKAIRRANNDNDNASE